MNVLRYAKLVAGDTSDSTHLYHVERPEGHFLLYFQGGGSLSYDAKAAGDEAEVARAFAQELANLESGTYHNEAWEIESETFDAEAEKRLKIFDHPTWGIKWGQVGGAPSDEAQFCKMLEKQIKEWKGSTHGMPVANHPYWPTFHAMVVEAVTEQYGDPIRLYRGIHDNQAMDILAGEPVSMRRFSAWTSDLSSARVYAAGKTKRGNLDWVVVQRDFSPSEIMFAPVAFSGPCEQPDILMELMHDVEHYGDEFIVSLPELVPGDYKVVAKPRGMRERVLRECIRVLLTEAARRPYDLPDGWAVYVDNVGEEYRIELIGDDLSIGSITFGPVNRGPLEPCLGAYKIHMSHADHGWGPLLYDVAMEIASMYSSGLIPDRNDVSPEARKVWQYYHDNRPDVEVVQLDDVWNTLTPDEYDNCLQDVARDDVVYPDEWTDSPLSKLYGVDGSPTIDKLKSMGRIHFEDPR